MSRHAWLRMQRRKIDVKELVYALENPRHFTDIPLKNGQKRKRVRLVGQNKLIVVIGLPNFVITVYRFSKAYAESKRKEKSNVFYRLNRNRKKR